jgi:DNA invertase Pin-like site-specific DNA recombinase
MSDDRQENSIDRQLSQVLPYCERKQYVVVGRYIDQGIAGDVFEQRGDFQRLLADARARLFDVIVCDEPSRLSREEPLGFIAKVAHPLKQSGVTIDTATDGPQGWDDLAQLILLTIRQDRAAGESRNLSRRVLAECARLAGAGQLLSSVPPYGYLIEYERVDQEGHSPKLRPVRYVPDPRRAHVVTWLFEQYADGGLSMDELAEELNRRGAPPPGRKGGRARRARLGDPGRARGEACGSWNRNGVRAILRNPKYTGALIWNRRSRGKYHVLTADGKVTGKPDKKDRPNDRASWIIVPGTHEPLVSQELFDRVQGRLATNRGGKGPKLGTYLFSGLVTCARCGQSMTGISPKTGRRGYRCHKHDGARRVVCSNVKVSEEYLLQQFDRTLQEQVLNPERLAALREEIRRQDEDEREPVAVARLRERLAALEANIRQGNTNLAILPPDRLPGVVATIREWEGERDRIGEELARRQGPGRLQEFDQGVRECEELLWGWRQVMQDADAVLMREIIRKTVQRVEIDWTARRAGGRTHYTITGGVFHVWQDLLCAEPGDDDGGALRYTETRAGGAPAARFPPRRSAGARRWRARTGGESRRAGRRGVSRPERQSASV